MDSKKQYNNSQKQADKMLTLQPEKKSKQNLSSSNINFKEKQLLTVQYIDNRQKLIDFISDKKKLSLKSYFDQRGTNAFLNGKEEAMKKIVLNEYIEESNLRKEKKEKIVKKIKKNIKKMKSEKLVLNNIYQNKLTKEETIKNQKKTKNRKSISNKYLTNLGENKLITLKEILNDVDLEEQINLESKSPVNKSHKKRKSYFNEKVIKSQKHNKIEKISIDKSINSIQTVDSKLFDNKMEYDNYKRLATKGDITLFEDILYELDVNKK